MSSVDPLGIAAGARIGATFRLLMQVRFLLAIVSLLLVPYERRMLSDFLIVAGIALLSVLAAFGWRQIVPSLVKHPVLIGFDVFVSYAVLETAGVLGPFFLFTVVTSAVAGLLYRLPGLLLVCTLQVMLYYTAAVGGTELVVVFQTAIAMPAFYLIVGFVGIGLRGLYDEYAALDEARHRAEIGAAAAEERTRLAREMHDSLAKTLRGIALSAIALPIWVNRSPRRAEDEARRIAAAAEIASREVRELISDLRDYAIDRPLAVALREIVESWAESAGISADVRTGPDIDLPLRQRYEVLAILKEALENVARHAGASSVTVELTAVTGRQVVMIVSDDGNGFSMTEDLSGLVRNGHYGLVGMRERASTMGAALSVTSKPGEGTTVTVTVAADEPESRRHLEVA
ncbi:sensor histidine kinase [Actinomadura sp. HBU206391]|uniref:sensor histidine kinase n=1 Tax=Actinomadura sp. HBU206391 TaxID=2731692 RepID=UPI00164FC017|nr:histidine kinase [Actinomadura sp. HBU206391]MBC6461867.1 hypothetical protein [Actinomadura sp. HBU206391]